MGKPAERVKARAMSISESSRVGNILGNARAEADTAMLADAFVETADYRALIDTRSFNFVVGRRGTGKSALFSKVRDHFQGQSRVLLRAAVPREYESLDLQHLLAQPAADYRLARAVARLAWQLDILSSVAESVSQQKRYKIDRVEAYQHWKVYRDSHVELTSASGVQRCAAIVRSCVKEPPFSLVPNAIATKFRVGWLEDRVREMLIEIGCSALLLWDGLDEGWMPTAAATAILGGLAAAVADLADSKVGTYCIVFVRDNMFRALASFDNDFSRHIEGPSLRLRWDGPSLLNLVANRLRIALDLKDIESDVRVWNRLVQRELKDREGFERCLHHTLYRPRDILVLLNQAYVDASRAGRKELIGADIETASRTISSSRLNDLLKEYETVLPGLNLFIKCFEGRPAIDSFSNVIEVLDRAAQDTDYSEAKSSDFAIFGSGREIFFALYSVGFIGLGDEPIATYRFCHDGSPTVPADIEPARTTAIHPCYWRALNLVTENQDEISMRIDDEYVGATNASGAKPLQQQVQDIRTKRLGQILSELPKVHPGREGASDFEGWVLRTLKILFAGRLHNFEAKPNKGAVNQRDIVATNSSQEGFWRRVLEDYHCRQVVFEAKNYAELAHEDFRQAADYASGSYGQLVVVVFRSENEGVNEHQRAWLQEAWHNHQVVIFTVPAPLLCRCVSKLRTTRKHDYTESVLSKRLDTFERSYLSIRHGRTPKRHRV